MNIPNSVAEIEGLSHSDLISLRAQITAMGKASELPIGQLEVLCAIYARLRQQSSGPPKEKKKKEKPSFDPSDIPG